MTRCFVLGLLGVLVVSHSALARERRRCKSRPICSTPTPCLATCQASTGKTYGPCLCPKEFVEDDDPNDDHYLFIVARYEGNCKCTGGDCSDPVMLLMPTDEFLDYPQYCEDLGVPCAITSKSGRGNVHHYGVGLNAPLDPSFVPTFPEVSRVLSSSDKVEELCHKFVQFGPLNGKMVTAKVFIFYLPAHTHPGAPPCRATTALVGFEVKPDSGTHIDFVVTNPRSIKRYDDVSDMVYYVNTGAVTFPVIVAEQTARKAATR